MSHGCKLRSGFTITFEDQDKVGTRTSAPNVVHIESAVDAYDFVEELRSVDEYVAINEGQISFYHLGLLADEELHAHAPESHH